MRDVPEIIAAENREQLDEAIRKYTAENFGRHDGVVTGWMIIVTSTRFDEEGTTFNSFDYSCGDANDLAKSIGMVQLALWDLQADITGRSDGR